EARLLLAGPADPGLRARPGELPSLGPRAGGGPLGPAPVLVSQVRLRRQARAPAGAHGEAARLLPVPVRRHQGHGRRHVAGDAGDARAEAPGEIRDRSRPDRGADVGRRGGHGARRHDLAGGVYGRRGLGRGHNAVPHDRRLRSGGCPPRPRAFLHEVSEPGLPV
ncbi:MAG: Na(+) H(+) antiporter subunit E, partial [uncultured Rubrobacteraceae bacterium]